MPPGGFETAIPGIEGPQTYALDRTATGISQNSVTCKNFFKAVHKYLLVKPLLSHMSPVSPILHVLMILYKIS
jgi:hypothetical protein